MIPRYVDVEISPSIFSKQIYVHITEFIYPFYPFRYVEITEQTDFLFISE